MEEGSLLNEALKHRHQVDQDDDDNTLIVDVFSLSSSSKSSKSSNHNHHHQQQQLLIELANLSQFLNQQLAEKQFLWHMGGDGPIFGIHVTIDNSTSIPHLRAYCRYGSSVLDEWVLIHFLQELSAANTNNAIMNDVAISCWDVPDGQVMLIATAETLPDWVDQDPTDDHRYACWLHQGVVKLIRESHTSLSDALFHLKHSNSNKVVVLPALQSALKQCLHQSLQQATKSHTTAVAVPRKFAQLLSKRPDLVHVFTQSFHKHVEDDIPPKLSSRLRELDDWGWTTVTLSRTNYAMMRTLTAPPHWPTTEALPTLPVEAKRLKRTCQNQATPHLQHALELGVRLVIGYLWLVVDGNDDSIPPPASLEQRLAYWSRVVGQCSTTSSVDKNNDNDDKSNLNTTTNWILEAYQQGPNHSDIDLQPILKCPVFPEEQESCWTARSHPEISLSSQLKLSSVEDNDDDEECYRQPPRPEDVDDESTWMVLGPSGPGPTTTTTTTTNTLDGLLEQFQSFLVRPSGVDGVEPSQQQQQQQQQAQAQQTKKLEIRPRVVLNLLHAVLKKKGDHPLNIPAQEPDPFFYEDDYNDAMNDDEEEEVEGMEEEEDDDDGMKHLMQAMDEELAGKTTIRQLDAPSSGDGQVVGEQGEDIHGELAEGAHVLKNMLDSLEASHGTSGPAKNLIQELGVDPNSLVDGSQQQE